MKYKIVQRVRTYNKYGPDPNTKAGTDMGYAVVGSTFESTRSINGWIAMASNRWIQESACRDIDPVPPVEPPADTFPPYIPIGAIWQVRFRLDAQAELTEWYTFVRVS